MCSLHRTGPACRQADFVGITPSPRQAEPAAEYHLYGPLANDFIDHTGKAMALTPGARLGHYEIVALVGTGGMGEVYEARDPRLKRTVAIKVLIDDLSKQADARVRFEREAQAIAGLNHPHIATLHDVGRHGQTDFLVMEMLEGETLAKRLAQGPLPLDRALQYGIEIAAGLDQAHQHGVVHRDLKPSNIMLTRSGVKLLDFGLAKLRPSGALGGSVAATRTGATSRGVILGTVQYMAPEQIEGREADARTDLFAFGAVLHEMVTGQRAFEGTSRASLMTAILRDTPPAVSTLQSVAPAALDRLIVTCMAKDPDDRWQSARDVWRELTWIDENRGSADEPLGERAATATKPRGAVSAGVATGVAVVLALVAGAAAWLLKPVVSPVQPPLARLTLALPPGDRIGNLKEPSIAISPDGGTVAYVGQHGNVRQLFLRALDAPEAHPLAGTEGAAVPFFSPDGQWLAFFSDGKLRKTRLTGTAPQVVCDAAVSFGGTWGPDDTIYFVPFNTTGVWKVPAAGGVPQQLTTVDRTTGEVSHRWPEVLPGGKALIFTVWTGPGSDEKHLHLQLLTTGERHVLLRGASTGRYVATGHLLYSRDDAVMAVPFDVATLQLNGQPVALEERVLDDEGAHYAVSDAGPFAYLRAGARRFDRRLVWVDRKGGIEPLATAIRPYTDPMISPDGRFAAFTTIGPVESIWIHDFSRNTQTSVTSTASGSSQAPVWTADGRRIVYRGTRAGFRNLFWKAVDGSGDEERLTQSENLQTPTSSSSDGSHVGFAESGLGSGVDIWILRLDARMSQAFLKTPTFEGGLRFSPNGRWVAYTSDESGSREVYVRPFPGPGGRVQISSDGGNEPAWSRTGRELFYRRGDQMLAVAIGTTPVLTTTAPRVLFEGSYLASDTGGAGYDVAADGRFLMIQAVEPERPATSIDIVLNWFDDLRRRAPVGKP